MVGYARDVFRSRVIARLVALWLAAWGLGGCRHESPPKPEAGAPPAATPSAAHAAPDADVTTHASMADDGGAAAAVTGTLDGEALRKRHLARIAADRSPVTVLKGGSARDLGRRICEAKVPNVPASTPVLLKPNLGGFDWFKDPSKSGGDDGVKGRITDPEFVRGVIQCLKARGMTNVTVAEGWGATHKEWERLVKVSGYEAMTHDENVPLVAMDDDGVFDQEGDKPGAMLKVGGMDATHAPTLLSPKILAETLQHGLFISLPKIKAHRFAVFSLGIKGTQGTVALSDASPAFRQKWRMHKELNPYLEKRSKGLPETPADREAYVKALEIFAERMADVLAVNMPDVVLAEGAPAMGGDGFQKLYPSAEHVAIGGTNVVQVDRVGAELLGLFDRPELAKELGGHRTSPLLEAAARRFGVDLSSRPALDGDGKDLLDSPRPFHFAAMAPFTLDSSSSAPTAHAASLGTGTIVLDGAGSDEAYKRAAPVKWDTDWQGRPTTHPTTARFVWSPSALYALFEVDATDLNVDASKPVNVERSKLYDEDCVELFVAPGEYAPRYYELELGPRGHFLDVSIERASHASHPEWSSGVEVKTTVDTAAHHAVIEARIPAAEIVHALKPGASLPLALYRMEGKSPRAYLAWSPTHTAKPDFHVFEAFGRLIIDP